MSSQVEKNNSSSASTSRKRPHENDDEETKNTKIVATHYNEIKEKGIYERTKSKIYYMRNFNNWVKSMLIKEYIEKVKTNQAAGLPLRVLDMCCGKGGDLLKWEKGGVTHLVCTDIADISMEQCEARYKSNIQRNGKIFSAEFLTCDSTLVRLRQRYKDPSMQFNLVSCQFALHYSFESLTQADCMIRNAAECLATGGYFIATIPDAYEIMKRQRQVNRKSFGNSIFNIEFSCDLEKPPLFGAKYKFHLEEVVDCPEFLVHFPTLVKICKKHGLKLIVKETFADYYQKSRDEGKYLLEKMQALQSYSAHNSNTFSNEEYSHADDYLRKLPTKKTIGTISKSEWEAITLYLVCAFQKCKTNWDAQGQPVYEL